MAFAGGSVVAARVLSLSAMMAQKSLLEGSENVSQIIALVSGERRIHKSLHLYFSVFNTF